MFKNDLHTLITFGAYFLISSIVAPNQNFGAWYGFAIVYLLISGAMHTRLTENVMLNKKISLNVGQLKSINTSIKIALSFLLDLLISLVFTILIILKTFDLDKKIEFINQMKSSEFIKTPSVLIKNQNYILDGTRLEWSTYYFPIFGFLQLLIFEVFLLLMLQGIVKKTGVESNQRWTLFRWINLGIFVCSFTYFCGQIFSPNSDDSLFFASHLWLITLSPLLFSRSGIELKFLYRFCKPLRTIGLILLCIFFVINFIFQLNYFTGFFLCILFASLIASNTISGGSDLSHLANKEPKKHQYYFIELVVTTYLFLYPIFLILKEMRIEVIAINHLFASSVLSVSFATVLLEARRHIAKTRIFRNVSLDFLWAIDPNSRLNFQLKTKRDFSYLIASVILFSLVTDLGFNLYSQQLSRIQLHGYESTSDSILTPTVSSKKIDTSTPDTVKESKTSQESSLMELWNRNIVQGLQLVNAPVSVINNLQALTKNLAFASSSCKNLTSVDFQAASEVFYCSMKLPGKPLALFVGNSHGAMLQDTIGQSLNDSGFSVESVFTSSCTISPKLIPRLNSAAVDKCKNFGEDLSRFVKKKSPDLIVIAESLDIAFLNSFGRSVYGLSAKEFLKTNLQNSINDFQSTTPNIILIDQFPQLPKISSCMASSGRLNNCSTSIEGSNINREINRSLGQGKGVFVVSPLPWICYQGSCPAIVNGMLVSPDGSHLTPEFAREILPQVKNQIRETIKTIRKSSKVNYTSTESSPLPEVYQVLLDSWQKKVTSSVNNLSTRKIFPSFTESAGKDPFANPDCYQSIKVTGIQFDGLNTCVTLGGAKRAVFFGNSHARMLQTTVSGALKNHGFTTYTVSTGSCVVANVTPIVNGKPMENCDKFRFAANALIDLIKPEIVVVSESNAYVYKGYLPAGVTSAKSTLSNYTGFWNEYLRAIGALKKKTKTLIVLGNTPNLAKSPIECVDVNGRLGSDCAGDPTLLEEVYKTQKGIVKGIKAEFLDTRTWLCTPSVCPTIIDNTLAYSGSSHLSFPIQKKLLPLFDAYLSSIGI